jgi:LysM repeat protein
MYKVTLAAVLAAGLLLGCKPQEPPPPAPGPAAPKVVAKEAADDILSTSRPPRTAVTDVVTPPATQPVAPPAGASRKYVVKKGDSLIQIARTELGSEHRLKDIKALNPSLDPNVLKVGQEIVLPAK